MQDFASAELKLLKHQAGPPDSLQNNPVLSLNTAAISGGFLGAEARDAVILEMLRTQAALSSMVSENPLFYPLAAVRTANITLTGKQHGSVIFTFTGCPAAGSDAVPTAPALATAVLTGKHVGNILPSKPRPLSIQKAEIDSNISPPIWTIPAISKGSITAMGVYNDIKDGKDLQLLTHAVSHTALPQGQAVYDMSKGTLASGLVLGGERTGIEQRLNLSSVTSSVVFQAQPELLRAVKEGQLIQGSESKFDEKLTIETGGSRLFDEQVMLTITLARQFVEREIIRSPRSVSEAEAHEEFALLKSVIENAFVTAGQRAGKEQVLSKYERDQSAVEAQPHLGLLTATVSCQLAKPDRSEKLKQFELSSSRRTESIDIANVPLELQSATVTGKLTGKDLNAVPRELPLLSAPVQNSGAVSQMDSPVPLLCGVLSGALFGSGNQRGLRELSTGTGVWIGSFRFDEMVYLWGTKGSAAFDLKVQLIPCRSFDELIAVERMGSIAADEIIHLGMTATCDFTVELTPCESFDEMISLKRASFGLFDEQVNLSRNYLESSKMDEVIEILPRIWFDEVIILTATPSAAAFDESLSAEKSGAAGADETVELSMTYLPPKGGPVPSYLRNAGFDESIAILKPEFDECITITNNHNAALLGDVIRDSDMKAVGITIYAGQDFVLEQ